MSSFLQINGHLRVRHGIFQQIGEQIIQHTPQNLSVRHDQRRRIHQLQLGDQALAFHLFLKLPVSLPNHLYHIDSFPIDLQIAGRYPAGLHQRLHQAGQAVGLFCEDVQIFLYARVIDIFSFDQIYIINNRSKRRTQIVRYIGDQVCLHAFIPRALAHGLFQAVIQRIYGKRDSSHLALHVFHIQLSPYIPGCQGGDPVKYLRLLLFLPGAVYQKGNIGQQQPHKQKQRNNAVFRPHPRYTQRQGNHHQLIQQDPQPPLSALPAVIPIPEVVCNAAYALKQKRSFQKLHRPECPNQPQQAQHKRKVRQ